MIISFLPLNKRRRPIKIYLRYAVISRARLEKNHRKQRVNRLFTLGAAGFVPHFRWFLTRICWLLKSVKKILTRKPAEMTVRKKLNFV